jgi:hypothetical protein
MRNGRIKAPTAVALVLSMLVVAGCGGGSGGSSSSEDAALTKQQYVQRAMGICKRLSHKLVGGYEAFSKQHGLDTAEPSQQEREQLIANVLIPNVEEKIDALKTLPAPQGEEAKVAAILKSMEKGIVDAERHPAWLAEPTPAHPQPWEDTIEMASDYGIWLCGQAGG